MELVMNLLFLPVLISCFLIIRKHTLTRYVSILTFALVIINIFLESNELDFIQQFGVAVLVIHAFSLVIRQAMTLKGTRSKMILISVTGYLIIGLLGGFLAEVLERFEPGSYLHSAGIEMTRYNYIYYSYVTMTTLGYGDIIPITKKSESLSLLLVLVGQLYLAVIIAINISKFIQKKP
jgi:voltage-gated potassium channel Kch